MAALRLKKRQTVAAAFAAIFVATLLLLTSTGAHVAKVVAYATRPAWDRSEAARFAAAIPFFPPRMDLGQHADEASGTVATDASLCTAHGWRPRDHQNSGRRVIDVVLFSVELDLLELRIRELLPVVDVFVIAEAPNTFTGLPKPMVFDLNQDRFAFAAHKIQYVPLPGRELAVGEDPFNIEAENRNNVSKYLRTSELLQLREGELLIMSDVDEIPSREAIQLVRSCDGVPPNLHLRMRNFIYSYDFQTDALHWRAKIVNVESIDTLLYTHSMKSASILSDSGWHCSFCFPKLSDFVFKMKAYSHADRVTSKKMLDPQRIQKIICDGADLYDMLPEAYTFRDLVSKWGPVKKLESAVNVPAYLLEMVKNGDNRFKYLLPGGCVREE